VFIKGGRLEAAALLVATGGWEWIDTGDAPYLRMRLATCFVRLCKVIMQCAVQCEAVYCTFERYCIAKLHDICCAKQLTQCLM
jgi:hypothetical protein